MELDITTTIREPAGEIKEIIMMKSREEIIDMLLEHYKKKGDLESKEEWSSSTYTITSDTDIDDILLDLHSEMVGIRQDLDKRGNNEKLEELENRLVSMYTHELLEEGEKEGLWKQTEKQKRLI